MNKYLVPTPSGKSIYIHRNSNRCSLCNKKFSFNEMLDTHVKDKCYFCMREERYPSKMTYKCMKCEGEDVDTHGLYCEKEKIKEADE